MSIKNKKSGYFIPAAPVYFGTARGDIMAALQVVKFLVMINFYLGWLGPIAIARKRCTSITLQEMSMFSILMK